MAVSAEEVVETIGFQQSLLTLIYAISAFSVGIVVASPFSLPWYGYLILIVALALYTYFSGIKNQVDRYIDVRDSAD